jgi:cytochrome c-type biogenesis protein CcmH/NrfG
MTVEIDPTAFFANIELGNVCLRRGSRDDALHAYTAALQYSPNDPVLRQSIQDQIQRVLTQSPDKIPDLRNPTME